MRKEHSRWIWLPPTFQETLNASMCTFYRVPFQHKGNSCCAVTISLLEGKQRTSLVASQLLCISLGQPLVCKPTPHSGCSVPQ